MSRNEMFELVQQWIKRMDELHPGVTHNKLYFNVTYDQMQDILEVLVKRPRVIVQINGGVCTGISSDEMIFADILDYDNWEQSDINSEADLMFKNLEIEYNNLEYTAY